MATGTDGTDAPLRRRPGGSDEGATPGGLQAGSPFLTVPELAAWLRVPVSCVYEWTRMAGVTAIPAYKAGKRLVFDPGEALAWFKDTQRHRLLPVDRRRRAPKPVTGGRRAKKPSAVRVSADGQRAVTLPVPGATAETQGEP